MKKIIILLMGMVLVLGAMSCSVDAHDDLNEKITESENTESSKDEDKSNEDEKTPTAESEDEDNVYESKDDSEKEDEESPKLDESSENTEPKEDTEVEEAKDEDDTDESKNDSEKENEENNTVVENITWCKIDENTNILELNYFVCVDGSQTKLNLNCNNESEARKYGFRARAFVSVSGRLAVFNVEYKDRKLNFSDNNIPDINKVYTITNVTMEESDINIIIEWK